MKLPSPYLSICPGTVLKKKGCQAIVVTGFTTAWGEEKTFHIMGKRDRKEANCSAKSLYVYGYIPIREMSHNELLDFKGIKEEENNTTTYCSGSKRNIISCKILKGSNPLHEKKVPLKGRTVVGLKVKCHWCGKRCKVMYSRGEYIVGKHKQLEKETIRTKIAGIRRTK